MLGKNKFYIFILIFTAVFKLTAYETLPVQKGELFSLSFHSSQFQNRYYIADFDKRLLSYYGNEYFPISDEVVYYFKPIREGNTELKIIKDINNQREDIVYNVMIHNVKDDLLGYTGDIMSPSLSVQKQDTEDILPAPPLKYEMEIGLPQINEQLINKKVSLIKDLFDNDFYENAIEEGQKLLRNHLIEGVREDITYLIAEAYLKLDNTEEAINAVESLNNYQDEYINRSRIEYFKSKTYFDIEDYDNSILTLLRLINIYEDEIYVLKAKYLLAKINNIIGKTENSINQLRDIITTSVEPDIRAQALFLLGGIYESDGEQKDYYKAVDYYRILYNEYPDLEISATAREKTNYIRTNFF